MSVVLPLPKPAEAALEEYICRWEDGTVTLETYASAYPDYSAATFDSVTLERKGLRGEIAVSQLFGNVMDTVRRGGLAELLSISTERVSRLEQLALWRMTRGYVWYSSGYFVWEEKGLAETGFATGEKLILLSGTISALRLLRTGATRLELRAEAEINVNTLIGTNVETVMAFPPYSEDGGAIYLDTGTAVRLIAALPTRTSVTVRGIDYADEGSLLATQNLQSVTLPFVGNALSSVGNNYCGEFAYLFSDGEKYRVPPSLKTVRVTGGTLISHAFYSCPYLEEIDLCGVNAQDVHRDAFVDCTGLKTLHSPKADVSLRGAFSSKLLPCG